MAMHSDTEGRQKVTNYWLPPSGIASVAGTPFWLFEDNTGAGGINDSAALSRDRTGLMVTVLTGVPLNIRINYAASTSVWTVQAYPGGDPVPVPAGPGDRVSIVASDGATTTTFEVQQVRHL